MGRTNLDVYIGDQDPIKWIQSEGSKLIDFIDSLPKPNPVIHVEPEIEPGPVLPVLVDKLWSKEEKIPIASMESSKRPISGRFDEKMLFQFSSIKDRDDHNLNVNDEPWSSPP